MLFENALKAKLPIIGVQTDDPVNFKEVLGFLGDCSHVQRLAQKLPATLGPYLYWTDEEDQVSVEAYELFRSLGRTLIVQNPSKGNHLIFDAGILPTPEPLVRNLLSNLLVGLTKEQIDAYYSAVRGLSLRAIREVILLTNARCDGVTISEIRRTRASLLGSTTGLYLEDPSYDFYVWPAEYKAWMEVNKPYFHKDVHPKLIPRGLMFEGPPGVGKSLAAKVAAQELNVPLYRLDMSSTLDKYIGVAESRVSKILGLIDRESPAVLLLDEVEKIFAGKEDSTGVISRLMGQLLWWLAEHQSRVFTVMTTNDKSAIPPELYRQGRIDKVFKIDPLGIEDAFNFAHKVFNSVIGHPPDMKQQMDLMAGLQSIATDKDYKRYTHATVADLTYSLIKQNSWA